MTNKDLATIAGYVARKASVISHDMLRYHDLDANVLEIKRAELRKDLLEALTLITQQSEPRGMVS